MCNINLIYKKDEKPSRRLAECMNVMSSLSWISNNDGEGFISLNKKGMKIERNMNKIIYKQNAFLISTHQRLTTSGYGGNNIHPHEIDDFVLQHNGVIYGLGNNKESDTKMFFKRLMETNEMNKGNIIQSIKDMSKETYGSYSIVLANKKNNQFLYFKESSTRMYFIEDKDYFIMSTNEKNVEYAKLFFGIKSKIKEMKANTIFDIRNNLKKIDKIEECYNDNYYRGHSATSNNISKKSSITSIKQIRCYYNGIKAVEFVNGYEHLGSMSVKLKGIQRSKKKGKKEYILKRERKIREDKEIEEIICESFDSLKDEFEYQKEVTQNLANLPESAIFSRESGIIKWYFLLDDNKIETFVDNYYVPTIEPAMT
ncbi:hypothetical protein GF336_00255 [Candidatus Woesearchaeota archaeon]|nr:hypothetical protein [Candidatus Woesearchaeota archaeon]